MMPILTAKERLPRGPPPERRGEELEPPGRVGHGDGPPEGGRMLGVEVRHLRSPFLEDPIDPLLLDALRMGEPREPPAHLPPILYVGHVVADEGVLADVAEDAAQDAERPRRDEHDVARPCRHEVRHRPRQVLYHVIPVFPVDELLYHVRARPPVAVPGVRDEVHRVPELAAVIHLVVVDQQAPLAPVVVEDPDALVPLLVLGVPLLRHDDELVPRIVHIHDLGEGRLGDPPVALPVPRLETHHDQDLVDKRVDPEDALGQEPGVLVDDVLCAEILHGIGPSQYLPHGLDRFIWPPPPRPYPGRPAIPRRSCPMSRPWRDRDPASNTHPNARGPSASGRTRRRTGPGTPSTGCPLQ